MKASRWLCDARDLIFPILCPTCQSVEPSHDSPLCSPCTNELSWIKSDKDAKAALVGKNYFPKDIKYFDSILYYTKSSRAQYLLKAIKYWGHQDLAIYLGRKLAERLSWEELHEQTQLIPVPLHPKRMRTRGYNQSEEIAKGIIEIQSQWTINTNLLIRNIYESSQTKKGEKERSIILEKSFSIKHSELSKSTPLILIDDVITTGATAAACTSLFRKSGFENISILSLAISI